VIDWKNHDFALFQAQPVATSNGMYVGGMRPQSNSYCRGHH